MSMTLNLIDRLLARGRDLQKLGRDRDAVRVLRRLAGFQELPAEAAAETQARLAELHLRRRKYPRARRNLAAVLRHRPESAHYHHLMATAIDAEDTGDPQRAARHYRRALQLDPNRPECLLDYGLFNLREGRTEAGLTCLRRAVELAPEEPETLGRLADGLIQAGREDEARTALQAALFRHPRDARFRQLWSDFQFHQRAREQRAARGKKMRETVAEEPVLLPFGLAERTAGPVRVGSRVVRSDGPAPTPQGPHTARRSNRRHAQ
jgi:Tfp pilus assembly protein PilF